MTVLSESIATEFPKRRVVVVGDIVADQFLHGTIARVSREAPVFILEHDNTDTRAGAAANAAANVASLGGQAVLVGLIGKDENGALLIDHLGAANVDCSNIVIDDLMRTTSKVRVLAGHQYASRQQVIRIDYANRASVREETSRRLHEAVRRACKGADAIIVSDYGYGTVDGEVIDIIRQAAGAEGISWLVDSRHRLGEFPGAAAGTPNQEEAEQILGKDFTDESCEQLRRSLEYKALLVTRGNKGMTLFEEARAPKHYDVVGSTEPVDVTGAGDTVIGAFALGIASGLSFSDAANIANHAGGIVVMKLGTAVAAAVELRDSLEKRPEDRTKANRI